MVGPWISFLPRGSFRKKGGKLSDIEFLSIKEFDGKAVENESTRTTTGVLATLTAAGGKDLYLAKAKITVRQTAINVAEKNCIIELQLNGIVKETFSSLMHDGSVAGTPGALTIPYEFAITGLKVAATQVIKLQVVTLDSQQEVNGVIEGWQEDTAATPQIPTL